MTVYLGKKPVGATKIVKKEVAKTKFGASVDTFLGDVDENGAYVKPTGEVVLDLSGVKSVCDYAFYYKFAYENHIVSVLADTVAFVGKNGFRNMCIQCTSVKTASFESLEVVDQQRAFDNSFSYSAIESARFTKLKKISGEGAFYYAFINTKITQYDKVFPALEEVSGSSVLDSCISVKKDNARAYALSSVKKITGSTSQYSATLGGFYFSGSKWHFPRATEFTGYIWQVGSSYTGEIHFAAANQAAIEACDRYANKWGFVSATIYFDLMLSIVVNGVVYSRKHTMDGYTSWEDSNGNIVYTSDVAEPDIGTAVYSDQGTTQVGTVSEVA